MKKTLAFLFVGALAFIGGTLIPDVFANQEETKEVACPPAQVIVQEDNSDTEALVALLTTTLAKDGNATVSKEEIINAIKESNTASATATSQSKAKVDTYVSTNSIAQNSNHFNPIFNPVFNPSISVNQEQAVEQNTVQIPVQQANPVVEAPVTVTPPVVVTPAPTPEPPATPVKEDKPKKEKGNNGHGNDGEPSQGEPENGDHTDESNPGHGKGNHGNK